MDFNELLGQEIAKKKAKKRRHRSKQGEDSPASINKSVDSVSEQANEDLPLELASGLSGEKFPSDNKIGDNAVLASASSSEPQLLSPELHQVKLELEVGHGSKELFPGDHVTVATIKDIDERLQEVDKSDFNGDIDAKNKIIDELKTRRLYLQLEEQNTLENSVPLEIDVDDLFNNSLPKRKLHLQVRKYIKHIIKKWEETIVNLDKNDINSNNSAINDNEKKRQNALLLETKKDLVVILNKLRRYQLSDSMLISISTVLYHVQHREFHSANESYMKLSIGNAVWPIGVRSVGIHQRAADNKITGDDKSTRANIMIDDSTRRWITAIKRLITFMENTK